MCKNSWRIFEIFQNKITVYVVIFEWLNFRKYGKIKISKKYFRISWYPAIFEIFSSGIRLLTGGFEFAHGGGAETFCLNLFVRGHHIYKDIWSRVHGEELHCKRKIKASAT